VLDDTTIREFLRDDYAPIVDAVTLVTGDPRVAEDAVREALLMAWTESEAGEPVDALERWVTGTALRLPRKGARRFRADRRARSGLDSGSAARDVDDARVHRSLALLTWRQREVAVLRYVLRKDERETADRLRLKPRAVRRTLDTVRDLLAASLPIDDQDTADGRLDDALADRIGALPRRADRDPRLFEWLVKSMTRRERGTRARAVGSAVSVVAIGAVVTAIVGSSATGDDAEPSPSAPPFNAATLPGVPFPACYVTAAHSYASGGWFGLVYAFERGLAAGRCPGLAAGDLYLALDRGGFGRHTSVFGPIECFGGCRAFGTPDLDADGWNEFAVVVADGEATDVIQLYTVNPPDARRPFARITTVSSGTHAPLTIDWRGVGAVRAGAMCPGPGSRATWDLDIWRAATSGGDWSVREQRFRIHGATATQIDERRSTVTEETALPEGGSLEFCGALVNLR
jgi:DNA-directed RNA polymerase specialized sigma24 family protein